MFYCFGFDSALVMPTCSCSTAENLAAYPPKVKYHVSISFIFHCILQLILISIDPFHKPRLKPRSHRIAQSEFCAASCIVVCISLPLYACPGRHVFIGPHLYSDQVLTVDSDKKCRLVRGSHCKPKRKSMQLLQAIISSMTTFL